MRNVNNDLLRIIACFMVIVIHVGCADFEGNVPNTAAQIIHCVVADAVGIFFALTGAYWFREKNTWRKVIIWYFRILSAALLIVMLTNVFSSYIYSNHWGFMFFEFKSINISGIVNGILQRDAKMFGSVSSVYWYILDLGILVLWFPMLKSLTGNDQYVLVYIFLTLTSVLYADLRLLNNNIPSIKLFVYVLLPVQPALVLTGYMVNRYKDLISGRCGRFVPWLGLVLCYVLRFLAQKHLYAVDYQLSTFFRYDRFLSFFIIAFLMIAVNTLNICENNMFFNLISHLRTKTFGIYLVHNILVTKMRKTGLLQIAYRFALLSGKSIGTMLYTVCMALIIFLLSALIVFVWETISDHLRCFQRNKHL